MRPSLDLASAGEIGDEDREFGLAVRAGLGEDGLEPGAGGFHRDAFCLGDVAQVGTGPDTLRQPHLRRGEAHYRKRLADRVQETAGIGVGQDQCRPRQHEDVLSRAGDRHDLRDQRPSAIAAGKRNSSDGAFARRRMAYCPVNRCRESPIGLAMPGLGEAIAQRDRVPEMALEGRRHVDQASRSIEERDLPSGFAQAFGHLHRRRKSDLQGQRRRSVQLRHQPIQLGDFVSREGVRMQATLESYGQAEFRLAADQEYPRLRPEAAG
ncbi:MAG TPA: hypothetical protein VFK86_16350, partial [Bauldia sp.]|nr:hypothetical protein [Bauldia sp.]